MLFCTLSKQAVNGVIYRMTFHPIRQSTVSIGAPGSAALWDKILQLWWSKRTKMQGVKQIGYITKESLGIMLITRDNQEFDLPAQGWNPLK